MSTIRRKRSSKTNKLQTFKIDPHRNQHFVKGKMQVLLSLNDIEKARTSCLSIEKKWQSFPATTQVALKKAINSAANRALALSKDPKLSKEERDEAYLASIYYRELYGEIIPKNSKLVDKDGYLRKKTWLKYRDYTDEKYGKLEHVEVFGKYEGNRKVPNDKLSSEMFSVAELRTFPDGKTKVTIGRRNVTMDRAGTKYYLYGDNPVTAGRVVKNFSWGQTSTEVPFVDRATALKFIKLMQSQDLTKLYSW